MSDEKPPAVGAEGALPSPMTAIAPELPTGTALATPLRHHLMSGLNEAASSRMWKSIEGRLWGGPRARGRLAGLAVALACTMLIATCVGLLGQRLALWGGARRDDVTARGAARLPLQPIPPLPVPLQPLPALAPPGSDVPRERLAAQPPQAPGPLVLADGRAFEHLEGEAHAARSLRLSDGSSIEAEAGARVEALSSGASEFSLVVRRGRVRFSVTPGGPRRWSIEARGTRVEVVGTVLTVASNDEGVRVAVEVGAVVVRSASIADGVQRLGAGESLLLPATPKADVSRPLEAGGPSSVPAPPERRKPRSTRRSVPQEPVPQEPVPQEPVPRQLVPQQPEPQPALPQQLAPAQPAQVRELWTRADTARRAGDVREASQLLARLVREHPRDPRAPLGAFTLGTLLADELDRPADAAIAFRNALELGLPAMLRDACYLSLASALRDADDVAGVRAVVARYAVESPDGDQLSALREIERQSLTEPGSAP